MEITNQAVKDWLEDIKDSKKREKSWRKEGERILDIYNGECSEKIPFNILYSNTETLVPALYSQTPRPVVKRRFNQDESPEVEAAEKAGTRILEYFLDTNIDGYESFDDSMLDAVQDTVLPGRGVTQLKFDAILEENGVLENENPDNEEDEPAETLKWAYVCADSHKWDRVHFGYADKWSKMPWIAFESYLDEEECEELFDEDVIKEITFSENEEEETDDQSKKSSRKTAIFYQIWEKSTKKVLWICETYDGFVKEQDDPLGITGFFPCPKPLMLHRKSNDLMPTALYALYENQAKELNRITTRLNLVIEAIKVRGVYDGSLGDDLEKIMEGDDNDLFPTDKGASLVEGGFDKAIWLMPIEKLVTTAQALILAREQCKSVIYEVTGLSDVIRGSSKASETLGAQKIKESWGTMRLKNMQRDVQRYVRDNLRIMLDIASQKIPARFWKDLTGLPYPSMEEKTNAQMQLQALKQQEQQKQFMYKQSVQNAQMMGQKPPPPPPPAKPPEALLKAANSPAWEEILAILQDDFIRSYKIDIETNSTLDIEATEDQKQVSEFMNAMAQFMNGTMPMVKEKVLPFGAAKSMFLEIARRFRFGSDVEDQIKMMEEPKGPDPEQMKKQGEAMKKKAEELKKMEQKIEDEKKRAGSELDKKALDLQKREMEFDFQKQLFSKEIEFEKKMAQKDRQMELEAAKSEIGSIVEKTKRETQSMLDKHSASIEKTMEKSNANL